ncbi:hypothetical protein TSUD_285260 [Trifolium subterraneum]|uniref:Uncharacterized protein n=1 Tax=Trifolium subterraneum TaxID=3900 RepID=A0A2Z6NVB3_TRISU|nr:hypothetical protein TSUD_285260 [Trifolium subterraneum]
MTSSKDNNDKFFFSNRLSRTSHHHSPFISRIPSPRLSCTIATHFSTNRRDVATRSGGTTRAFTAPPSLLFSGIPLFRSFSDSHCHSLSPIVTFGFLFRFWASRCLVLPNGRVD